MPSEKSVRYYLREVQAQHCQQHSQKLVCILRVMQDVMPVVPVGFRLNTERTER